MNDTSVVDGLRKSNNNDNDFVRNVLKDWLSRKDEDITARPRTWIALAETVEDAGLPGNLAQQIEKMT